MHMKPDAMTCPHFNISIVLQFRNNNLLLFIIKQKTNSHDKWNTNAAMRLNGNIKVQELNLLHM